MNAVKPLFPALKIGAVLGLILRVIPKSTSPSPDEHVTPYEMINAYLEEQLRCLKVPGAALAIVEGDKIVHLRGFGRARPLGEAPTPQTPFFIGSLTKSFTALAVMRLVEAGRIELDAPIQRYLPWFRVADPEASARMTVRHLLNQTSGLPMAPGLANLADLDDRPDAAERQVRALSTLRLSRPLGSKFEYSNLNYNVLGLIIEAASGEPYSDYIQRQIFEPLEMSHSYTSQDAARQHDLAMGHRYWFGRSCPTPDRLIPSGSLASGQLISSAEDMAHYLIAYLNGGRYGEVQVISESGLAELLHPAAEINEMGRSFGAYAMGWISQEFGGAKIVSHSGIVPDFGASMALVPEQQKGLVLLYNANHAMLKMTFDELGLGTAQLLAGVTPQPVHSGPVMWAMRALLLIPLLQVAGVARMLRLLRRGRLRGRHLLLPVLPDLLAILTLAPLLGRMRGFLKLFMPDYVWVARLCGVIAVVWAVLRTSLILRALWRRVA
jgi:CubicO group peptidase (beta-lactamase class C family)